MWPFHKPRKYNNMRKKPNEIYSTSIYHVLFPDKLSLKEFIFAIDSTMLGGILMTDKMNFNDICQLPMIVSRPNNPQFHQQTVGLILGVEPRFAFFSITAEPRKIEYCIIYHLKGISFLYEMMYHSGYIRMG